MLGFEAVLQLSCLNLSKKHILRKCVSFGLGNAFTVHL